MIWMSQYVKRIYRYITCTHCTTYIEEKRKAYTSLEHNGVIIVWQNKKRPIIILYIYI